MNTDWDLLQSTADRLRTKPDTLGIRVSREHYLWLAERIRQLQDALDKSVSLHGHYARILNMEDGGQRLQFHNGQDWIARLQTVAGEVKP